jgi:hypothetical protein
MYDDAMHRTQIYLTAEEGELLDRAEKATGASRSELIRRAIRLAYSGREQADRLAALRASAGIWRDRKFTGAQYVDAIRGGGLGEGLRSLGLDE